jgi:uncharacterized membrane protein YqiK
LARSYVKAPANRAYVRTGGLRRKPGTPPTVVMNGGAFVFGLFHEITWVDLGTMAIEIERTEQNALLTRDPQYADIRAIFYIKVNPTVEGIIDAARTIGGQKVDAESVKALVDAKLDGALRDMAASFTLMSLHQERENFIQEVQNRLKGDLEENGLMLESVSILTLKAARQGTFPTDDVFGAQVARANAQVIQEAVRERNEIERNTEVAIKQKDTSAAKEQLTLEQELAIATAAQQREVRQSQAAEKSTADQFVYEKEQASETARIAKERSVELSKIQAAQDTLIKETQKQQEVETTEVTRQQAIEIAQQAKQIAVLKEQQSREKAERERLLIAAQKEEAAQAVVTVEQTAAAERQANVQVIEAERDARKEMIERKNDVEIEAYKKLKEAEVQATALQEISQAEALAAIKQAEALRTQAESQSDAEKMRADATRASTSASGLAEAEVMRAKAEAGQMEAEVIRAKGLAEAEAIKAKGLAEAEGDKAKAEALAAHEGVSQRLELERLRVQAEIEIGVARAQAMGEAIAQMQVKLIGSPETARSILQLMSWADGAGDVWDSLPPSVRAAGQGLARRLGGNGDEGQPAAAAEALPNLPELLPKLFKLVEQHLKPKEMQKLTVGQALERLASEVSEKEQALLAQVQNILTALPLVGDLNLEEVYLRYLVDEEA